MYGTAEWKGCGWQRIYDPQFGDPTQGNRNRRYNPVSCVEMIDNRVILGGGLRVDLDRNGKVELLAQWDGQTLRTLGPRTRDNRDNFTGVSDMDARLGVLLAGGPNGYWRVDEPAGSSSRVIRSWNPATERWR